MTTTKIEACPFCGASAHCTSVSDFRISSPRTGRRVTCDECPASAGAYGTDTEAIASWNRRAIQAPASPLPEAEAQKAVERCFEFWHGDRKITLYPDACEGDDPVLLKVWGRAHAIKTARDAQAAIAKATGAVHD